jgi:UDP-2,4-diacetamido-2,4,6-trideoxy-beta-L-altropyranose hydrolase
LLKTSPLLMVRADASAAIGSGHVMRCLALAKAWQNCGGNVLWLSAENIAALEERIRREGVDLRKIDSTPGTASDAEQTASAALRAGAVWVVVDGYRFVPEYIRSLKTVGLRVLLLDDDGRFDFYAADVILNQNICATADWYARREASTQLLLGSEYALLRPEFRAEPQNREAAAVARKLLITMGGSDPENVAGRVMRALSTLEEDLEAKVVAGSGNVRADELQSIADKSRMRFEIVRSPENMVPLMKWADVAISGAGSTCWELAYMGLPAIVIALSADQQKIAEGLAQREIAVSLGWHATLSEERIVHELQSLLRDHPRRLGMSERGRKLVDGRGAERVVEFLRNSL